MTAGLLLVTIPIIIQEVSGNPAETAMGIDNAAGNMEGKEVRYGSFYFAYYSGVNMAIPAGTITGMHDSYMPLSSVFMLVGMQVDAFFGGLGNNTVFWNISTALAMLCGRFIPIAGAIFIVGLLQQKKYTPLSGGSLPVDNATFGVFLFLVIIVLNALSFLPAFMLGPIAEHLSL